MPTATPIAATTAKWARRVHNSTKSPDDFRMPR
jgi:hypothetical protein